MPQPFGPDHQVVLDYVNAFAKKRYGAPSALLLPTAQRELIYDTIFELLRDLDDLPAEKES